MAEPHRLEDSAQGIESAASRDPARRRASVAEGPTGPWPSGCHRIDLTSAVNGQKRIVSQGKVIAVFFLTEQLLVEGLTAGAEKG